MKLIIDISEDVYTRLFDNGIQDNEIAVDDVCEMARALRLGTPLDDVIAEIEEKISHYDHFSSSNTANGLNMALEIIDKHIGKESEDT